MSDSFLSIYHNVLLYICNIIIIIQDNSSNLLFLSQYMRLKVNFLLFCLYLCQKIRHSFLPLLFCCQRFRYFRELLFFFATLPQTLNVLTATVFTAVCSKLHINSKCFNKNIMCYGCRNNTKFWQSWGVFFNVNKYQIQWFANLTNPYLK